MKNNGKLEKALKTVGGIIDAIAEELTILTYARSHQRAFMTGGRAAIRGIIRAEEWRALHRRLLYLKNKRLIEMRKTAGRLIISLSERGELKHLESGIDTEAPSDVSTFVMYDIPETQRHARDRLRWFLKSHGFKLEQRSIWRLDKDVEAALKMWVAANELETWVKIVRSPKLHVRE